VIIQTVKQLHSKDWQQESNSGAFEEQVGVGVGITSRRVRR
jgi:hypothetical protein